MGNQMLVIDGYRYTLAKKESNCFRIRWRCGRHSSGCKAAAVTIDKNLVHVRGWHDHDQYAIRRSRSNKRNSGSKREPTFW